MCHGCVLRARVVMARLLRPTTEGRSQKHSSRVSIGNATSSVRQHLLFASSACREPVGESDHVLSARAYTGITSTNPSLKKPTVEPSQETTLSLAQQHIASLDRRMRRSELRL